MKPAKIILNNDTLVGNSATMVTMKRQRDRMLISTLNAQGIMDTVVIFSDLGGKYPLNLLTPYFIGFLIDWKSDKRFAYPSTIYLENDLPQLSYSTSIPLRGEDLTKKYSSKFNVVRPFAAVNPAIEFSLERRIYKKFTCQVMGSVILPQSIWYAGSGIDQQMKGYRYALEIRRYFKQPLYGGFVGFEFNYLNNRYRDMWEFGTYDTAGVFTNYYIEEFGLHKRTTAFNFIIGLEKKVREQMISMDMGFGIKFKQTLHFDRSNMEDEMARPRHPNVHYFSNLPGNFTIFSFPVNIRIGYIF